jgi:hypothetical protein
VDQDSDQARLKRHRALHRLVGPTQFPCQGEIEFQCAGSAEYILRNGDYATPMCELCLKDALLDLVRCNSPVTFTSEGNTVTVNAS